MYIKIVDGAITDYKGVQQDTVIDGISIKGLARSEDDRVAYMPNAELILDTSERFIQISIDSNYLLTGAVVEQCTCMRQMVYETKDIAYIQDIEALSKKIDALAEQSHSNDIQTFSMRDEFATVDEINEVLTNNYVLKSENEELKAKINALETQIASLKPKYPWQEYYQGFDERVEFVGNGVIGAYLFYSYYSTNPIRLVVDFSRVRNIDPTAEYLCMLHAPTVTHYIRINIETNTIYINEISGRIVNSSDNSGIVTINYVLGQITSDGSAMNFDYVFKKTTS